MMSKEMFGFPESFGVAEVHQTPSASSFNPEEDNEEDVDTDCEDLPPAEKEGNSETEKSDTEYGGLGEEVVAVYNARKMQNGRVVENLEWKKTPLKDRGGLVKQNLRVHLPGVKRAARGVETILDSWRCLVDDSIINRVAMFTNQYIDSMQEQVSRARDAHHTDQIEIEAVIGLLYLAGSLKGSQLNLEDLWDADGYGVETFRLTMSLRRFKFLMRCIRFDDKESRSQRKKVDRLAAVRNLLDEFVENCQSCYSLGEYATIDERFDPFRGRCSFCHFIPSNPKKYGVKMFALVDAKLCYVYNLEIHAGKQPEGPFAVSYKRIDVVRRLCTPIFNTGRNITVVNWFCDVGLLKEFTGMRLSLVGTVKKDKWQVPKELNSMDERKEKSSVFAFREEGTMVSYVPTKKKNVVFISSMHFDDRIDPETQGSKRPDIVTFYNETKGGVDTVNKQCTAYSVARKTRRWSMVVFFSLLNIAGINAQILFIGNNHNVKNRRHFLIQLAKQLIMPHMIRRGSKSTIPIALRTRILRVTCQPPPSSQRKEKEARKSEATKRKKCKPCYAVAKRQRNTRYSCQDCGVYLCVDHICVKCAKCCAKIPDSVPQDSVQS